MHPSRISLALGITALLLLAACATGRPPETGNEQVLDESGEGPEPGPTVWDVWLMLGGTTNTCDSFDYYPDGGMRIFHCHVLSVVDWADILQDAPHPIFLSGPHVDGEIKLRRCRSGAPCARTFGHYNPAFVGWAGEALIPGAEDDAFRRRTQKLYERYVRNLARTFWGTHLKLLSSPACTKGELALYQGAMDAGEADHYERWYNFMDPSFCSRAHGPTGDGSGSTTSGFQVNGNVAKSTVGFWLRRRIDGTEGLFLKALERLLGAYDAQWLAAQG
jgi:hypothetical protein